MTLSNVSLSDTFQTWLTRTNQLVVLINGITDGASNANVFYANVATVRNSLTVGGINVGSTLVAAFNQANTDLTIANLAFNKANAGATAADTAGIQANTARNHANAAFAQANSSSGAAAYNQANTARDQANAAYSQANNSSGAAAYARANNSYGNVAVSGTNSGYNWTSGSLNVRATNSSNTITFVAGSGVELPMDTGNFAVLVVTYGYDQANTSRVHANAAFSKANSSGTDAVSAFNQANTANTRAYQCTLTNSNVKFYSIGVGTEPSNTQGEIRATGEVTSFYSDRRMKVIDNYMNGNSLWKVNMLNGYIYHGSQLAESFGYDTELSQVGVMADEVENVLPQAVTLAPFDVSVNENGKDVSKSGFNYKTVKYERLVPLLIEAIKELTKKVDDLERRIELTK